MDTLFQELLDKGLIEIGRISPNFSVALASSVLYQFELWEISQMLRESWRWQ